MQQVQNGNALVDLSSCDQEPIHIISNIQSHGLLFALSEPDLIVRQVSANVDVVLGMSPQVVLGTSFQTVVGAAEFERFRSRLLADDLNSANALRIVLGRRALEATCIAHRHDGVLIVECELTAQSVAVPPSELAENIEILLKRLGQASGIRAYSEVTTSEIQRLSGFDSVMVYRFDAQWNGEVIAETRCVPDPVDFLHYSFLGLHFPAGDIPVQARQLFLTNPVRAIADIASIPVPVVPQLSPSTGRALDLTYSVLRSVSPVHVEYLQNMDVRASLTLSIIVDERLWGLVACHHHAPRPVDCSTRSICELIAQNLALHVALRNADEARRKRQMSLELLDGYTRGANAYNEAVDATSLREAGFLELLDADGLVSRIGGVTTSEGLKLADESLHAVVASLRAGALRGIASSEDLGALAKSAGAKAAGGALFIEISRHQGDYLMFLRSELVKTVSWGGNRDESFPDTAGKLHPRSSFAQWRQTVLGRSAPWTELQLEAARFLRAELIHSRDAQRFQN
jgi:chemotaxis family two-component system sensor kinase Cph1